MFTNTNGSSLVTNGSTDGLHHQKLLSMMEANGQYPINVDQSMMESSNIPNHTSNGDLNHNPFSNVHHGKPMSSDVHHTMNGFVQNSFTANGNAGHVANDNMEHSMNGHAAHDMNCYGALEMNGTMEHSMNGHMQHTMNGNIEHGMNGNIQHAMNGHVNGMVDFAANGDMHVDHADHSLVNQAPQRCMMLCGHFQ